MLVYPILRQCSERLALGYVVFRSGFETAGYLGFALFWLLLALPGREYVAVAGRVPAQPGATLLGGHDMVGSGVFTLVFLVGALLFHSVLFRARLVPRWLSGWGLLAVWLMVRGFDTAAIDPVSDAAGAAEVTRTHEVTGDAQRYRHTNLRPTTS